MKCRIILYISNGLPSVCSNKKMSKKKKKPPRKKFHGSSDSSPSSSDDSSDSTKSDKLSGSEEISSSSGMSDDEKKMRSSMLLPARPDRKGRSKKKVVNPGVKIYAEQQSFAHIRLRDLTLDSIFNFWSEFNKYKEMHNIELRAATLVENQPRREIMARCNSPPTRNSTLWMLRSWLRVSRRL